MGFIEAVKTHFRRYADFEGRSCRSEMWWAFLFWWLVALAFGVLASVFESSNSLVADIVLVIFFFFYLGTIIPGIAVRVRRFHDQDRSGWMYLLRLIPLVGGLIIIIFMCLEGTRGQNRFGADPLGQDIHDTFS